MKKALLIGVGILVVLVAVGIWFWSLGSVAEQSAERVTVVPDHPSVEVRRAGSGDWNAVSSETEVAAGDEVRTDATGQAVIRFYGRGETRLQEGTSVTVERAAQDLAMPMDVQLELAAGRIWSRIIRLFDLDSSFSVRTDTVVATVRGTAFDLSRTSVGTTLSVSDASVELASANGAGTPHDFIVPEGFKTSVSASGFGAVEPFAGTDAGSDWVLRNITEDDAFSASVKDSIAASYERLGRVRPDRPLAGLVSMSERLHLAFAGNDAPRLHALYIGRRIYGIKTLVDDGKSGLAFQEYAKLEQDLRDVLPSPDGAALVPYLRSETADLMILLHDVMPSSSMYRLKLKLEDLSQLLVSADAPEALFARMLATDARLDEASNLIASGQAKDALLSMDAANQGIANAEHDIDLMASSTTPERSHALRMKLQALKARESTITIRLTTAQNPPQQTTGTATTTQDGLAGATSTPSNVVPAPSDVTPPKPIGTTSTSNGTTQPPTQPTTKPPPPTQPVIEAPWDRITLSAQPNPIETGGMAQLRVTGSRADGTTGDLTARSSFRLIGTLGSLNGPTFTASQAGSVTIEASVVDNGVTKTARTVVQVNAAVTLQRLELVPQGSMTVVQGSSVPVAAKAWYTSGLTSIVTPKTSWDTSDPNIGSVSNGVFSAWVNGLGTVTITGTYSEAGVTKSGSAVFTVTAKSVTAAQ